MTETPKPKWSMVDFCPVHDIGNEHADCTCDGRPAKRDFRPVAAMEPTPPQTAMDVAEGLLPDTRYCVRTDTVEYDRAEATRRIAQALVAFAESHTDTRVREAHAQGFADAVALAKTGKLRREKS